VHVVGSAHCSKWPTLVAVTLVAGGGVVVATVVTANTRLL
jgi:hypothetical protein